MLGNVFKIGSWTMGYVLIAKGKSKIFALTGIGFNAIYLLFTIYGYRFWGIAGVGIAFFAYYIIHFIGIALICSLLFNIRFKRDFRYLFITIFLFAAVAFFLQRIDNAWIKYISAAIFCSASIYLAYIQLNKRLNIHEFIANKRRRK